jgi:flagellar hook-associated protein 1 FlgK
MADVLSTSVTGLLAFQRALDVTSNNVANSATPGYSVERLNLTEQPAQPTASGYIGSGVQVQSITRSYDELLAAQVRSSQASYSSFNTYATLAAQVDNMLSANGSGLSGSLQSFVNALQTVANSPASTAQRQALLGQAQSLTQQLQSYDSQLSQYASGVESQIGSSINQINSIASNIATLNTQIAQGLSSTGQTPNALMDQRDQLVDQLSQIVSVSTVTQGDGQMNVYIGTGQALVAAGTAQKLAATPDPYDPTRHDIGLVSGPNVADITSQITGGSLGGLLSARSQVLDAAQNAVGRVSVALATIVNQQQQAGMDLTGSLGQPMFAVGGVQATPAASNAGNAALAVTRTSLGALTTDDYKLQMSAGNWQLIDTTTGQTVSLTGSGTNASPFQAAGLSIVVTGTGSAGDSFQIRPTAAATAGLSLLLSNPAQIAAAAPIQASAAAANTGTGAISPGTVVNAANAQLLTPATIQFVSATQYTINGSGPFTYTSGAAISANGWSVTISGAPATGDTYTVTSNAGGTGDNRNVLAMVDALSAKTLDGGTTPLASAANNLVSQIGVLTQQAQANASAQQAVNQDAVTARNNVSGVNLDEEAANMVRYQQAYQAMAQTIQASNQMFKSLITAIANG